MAAKAILTTRELKNKVTGIDLMVPDYEEIQGKITKKALYHVIVITRLFYYKSSRHKESDVVQFMISKKYEEFEDLYQKLNARFPSVIFPDLPRKPLVVSSSTFHERRKVMDEVMHMVARTQKLCCSPMVLEFLSIRKPKKPPADLIVVSDDIFEERNAAETESMPEAEANYFEKETNGKEEEKDLFVAVDLDSSAALDIDSEDTAFTASKTGKLELHASLFEDELDKPEQKDDSDLFMPADVKTDAHVMKVDLDQTENTDDLLDVDEDVDDLLALSKKSERKASIKAAASTRPSVRPKPHSRSSFDLMTDDEDLSLLSSSKTESVHKPKEEADLFKEARKMPLRDKREKLVKTDTLDDIFEKSSADKNLFSKNSNDDDLFTKNTTAAVKSDISAGLDEDDIMKYINDNLKGDVADLEL